MSCNTRATVAMFSLSQCKGVNDMEERHELIELVKTLDNMIDNMKKISQMWEVSEEARHVLEDQYPFADSFDEILRAVMEWRDSVFVKLRQVNHREMEKEKEMEDVLLDMFVTDAKYQLLKEGAYTENARIAFLNYPFVASSIVMQYSPEEREMIFKKMAEIAKKSPFSGRKGVNN